MRMGMGESTKNFSAFFVVRGCTRVYEGVRGCTCVYVRTCIMRPKKIFFIFFKKTIDR